MGIKDIRRNHILDRAIKLFCAHSIAEVKIKDVAEECNIGEATFYRYFSKRSSLVVACALKLSEMKLYDLPGMASIPSDTLVVLKTVPYSSSNKKVESMQQLQNIHTAILKNMVAYGVINEAETE